MTVAELREYLADLNPDTLVVMSRDPEGNGYSPLHNIDTCVYDNDEFAVWYLELTDDLRKRGYGEDDVFPNGVPAVAMWPSR